MHGLCCTHQVTEKPARAARSGLFKQRPPFLPAARRGAAPLAAVARYWGAAALLTRSRPVTARPGGREKEEAAARPRSAPGRVAPPGHGLPKGPAPVHGEGRPRRPAGSEGRGTARGAGARVLTL